MIFYLLLIVQLIVVCQGELTIKAVKEYNIVETNTPLKLSCEISGLENETHAVVIEWKNIISNETITSHTTGYMVDVGSFADGKRVTTLSLDGNVNTEDTVYGCGVKDAIDKDYKVAEFTIYLFEVEAKHQVVNVSTPATLGCYFTDIIKNLTVTWQEKGSQANLSTVEGYAVDMGLNLDNTQTSTLDINANLVTENKTYLCSIYPDSPYSWVPYSTEVFLTVNKASHSSGFCFILLPLLIMLA